MLRPIQKFGWKRRLVTSVRFMLLMQMYASLQIVHVFGSLIMLCVKMCHMVFVDIGFEVVGIYIKIGIILCVLCTIRWWIERRWCINMKFYDDENGGWYTFTEQKGMYALSRGCSRYDSIELDWTTWAIAVLRGLFSMLIDSGRGRFFLFNYFFIVYCCCYFDFPHFFTWILKTICRLLLKMAHESSTYTKRTDTVPSKEAPNQKVAKNKIINSSWYASAELIDHFQK